MLLIRKPWDSQPQEDSSVDWGGQQAQGLLFANVGSSPVLHANRGSILPSFVGTSLGAVAGGAGYRFTGASTQSVRWDTGITVAGTDALTIEALVWGSSFPSLATIVNLSDVALTNGATAGANGAQRGILSFNSTDPCNIYSWGGSNDYDSTVKFAANSLQHIIITKAAGTGAVQITVHRNGTQIAQGNSSGATPSTTSGPYFYVGGRHPSGSASITGIVLKSAIYSGIISAAQRQSIFANPWQLFAPRSIWVPVSAGGGSVTGTSATTNANDTSAASGTTTVVGTSATTNANDTATASGSVGGAVTGTSATTNANDTSSASGTTTVTGTVAYSNANDSAAASGWAGSVSGTAAVTNANDTAQASGTVEGGATDTHDGFWSREWAKLKKREEKKPTIAEVVEIVKESPQVLEVVRAEVVRKYPQVNYAEVRENVQLQRFIAKQLIEAAEEEDDIETMLLMA